jgi:hypothetical protein
MQERILEGHIDPREAPIVASARGALIHTPQRTDMIPSPMLSDLGTLPMGQRVPLPAERIASPELLNTAGHELGHALAARTLGISVESIDVRPQGPVLGQTKLGGSIPLEAMKIVAAAGAVNPPYQRASGFGSDMAKVDFIHAISHGSGTPPETAVSLASGIIQSIPIRVRYYASSIIAHLGFIHGSDLPAILERASKEAELEGSDFAIPEFPGTESHKMGEQTIIKDYGNDVFGVSYAQGNTVLGKETYVCAACGQSGIHNPNCPIVKRTGRTKIIPSHLEQLLQGLQNIESVSLPKPDDNHHGETRIVQRAYVPPTSIFVGPKQYSYPIQ